MWEQDWALLGIAPTPELPAIKKAYALKLRVTRPDDDAEAYQALRSAYERIQQWARWQADEAAQPAAVAQPGEALPAAPAATEQPAATTTPSEPPPEPVAFPEDAIEQLQALWEQRGDDALVAEWPAVNALLDAQPLASGAAWSAHFAQWVVQQERLPAAFTLALDRHFGWQEDFRAERQIGTQLAEAVRQALAKLQEPLPEPLDPALQEAVKPLQQFEQLRRRGGLLPWLLALLLQPMLSRLFASLHPRSLALCGFDPPARRAVGRPLALAWLLRDGLLCGGVLLMFVFASQEEGLAMLRMGIWCMWCVFWLGASHYLGLFMQVGFSLEREGGRSFALPVQRWRRQRHQPALGLGVIAAAAALAATTHAWDLASSGLPVSEHVKALLQVVLATLPWLLLWAGALLAWPLNAAFSPLCIALLVPVGGLLFHWATPADPWAAVMAISVLYVLVGVARFEGRIGSNIVLDAFCRPVTITLDMAQRWGWRFALLPGLLTLAYLFSSRPPPAAHSLALAWVALTVVLHQLQHHGERWALRRVSRA